MYIYIFYESWCDSSRNVWFKNMCVCVCLFVSSNWSPFTPQLIFIHIHQLFRILYTPF